MEVVNYSEREKTLYLDLQIEVNHFNTDEFLITNEIRDHSTVDSSPDKNTKGKLRIHLQHLNKEERV